MPAATNSLQLLGRFKLSVGARVAHLPLQAQRLVAYLAVTESPAPRHPLAERLWPFAGQGRAQGNLRTALWRVRHEAPSCVTVDYETVELHSRVIVDYRELFRHHRSGYQPWGDENRAALGQLSSDLLPGWDEEWLIIARERARQVRMRSLEQLSQWYLTSGNIAAAIEAAFGSIEIEPLRESAHLALIEAHVAEGNLAEAAHQAARFKDQLHRELGITPSAHFEGRLTELGVTLAGLT